MSPLNEKPINWSAIATWSPLVLAFEVYLGIGMSFSPGWANQWPGGLPIQLVFPAGISTLAFVTLMTAAVWIGATLASRRQFRSGWPPVRLAVILWLALTLSAAAAASALLFVHLRAEALEVWPNG